MNVWDRIYTCRIAPVERNVTVMARNAEGELHEVTEKGLPVDDPHDLEAFGAAVDRLLHDRTAAERLAMNGRRHIEHHFLGDRHVLQYAELLAELIGGRSRHRGE